MVRRDDTLYSIAWRHNLDFRDLARWNGIGGDFRISVGQVLALGPGTGASSPRAAPSSAPKPSSPRSQPFPARAAAPREAAPAPGASQGASRWVWPTERAGAPRSVPGGGILLSGRLGQDVRAACVGRVVYAGSGLRGYGNLIIIKHADSLLSAYAHNRELLVHDGEEVAAGQVIAHMGESPQQLPVLYFEIRQNGRPVDPLPFLPKAK
ncbi:MAG: peptidoglycan DD-metalloendopeptidase family protein [Steroidobacteraceae bacterium]